MRYGLIGGRLSHSHSPTIHKLLGGYEYALYELAPEQLESFLSQPGIGGLNVTIPYKRAVLPYCDTLDEKAQRTGSVNTLVFRDGRISGYNTDYDGFLYLARRAGVEFRGRKVVILGSGGTSATVQAAVSDEGAREVVVVSRSSPENYDTIARHADADVLINTTPVGMYPQVGVSPVSFALFPRLCGVLDVIYNPLRTRLILEAQSRGIPCAGGLAMLVAQAHAAVQRFTDTEIPVSRIDDILRSLEQSLSNIVLIGMPGCGKTRVGEALCALTGRPLVDTDELIEQEWKKSPGEIIETEGEAAFRDKEAAAVLSAAKQGGRIIATGGGVPLFERNRIALLQNGRIFYLKRDIARLAVAGRPLSKNLQQLLEQRDPIYRVFANAEICNDGKPEDVAKAVLKAFCEH